MPPDPTGGVPDKVAVPFPLATKLTPDGSAPDSDKLGFGQPQLVTLNEPALPTVKVVWFGLVMPGAWPLPPLTR